MFTSFGPLSPLSQTAAGFLRVPASNIGTSAIESTSPVGPPNSPAAPRYSPSDFPYPFSGPRASRAEQAAPSDDRYPPAVATGIFTRSPQADESGSVFGSYEPPVLRANPQSLFGDGLFGSSNGGFGDGFGGGFGDSIFGRSTGGGGLFGGGFTFGRSIGYVTQHRPSDQHEWTDTDVQSLRRDRYEAEQVRHLFNASNGVNMSGNDDGSADPYQVPDPAEGIAESDELYRQEQAESIMSVEDIYAMHEEHETSFHDEAECLRAHGIESQSYGFDDADSADGEVDDGPDLSIFDDSDDEMEAEQEPLYCGGELGRREQVLQAIIGDGASSMSAEEAQQLSEYVESVIESVAVDPFPRGGGFRQCRSRAQSDLWAEDLW